MERHMAHPSRRCSKDIGHVDMGHGKSIQPCLYSLRCYTVVTSQATNAKNISKVVVLIQSWHHKQRHKEYKQVCIPSTVMTSQATMQRLQARLYSLISPDITSKELSQHTPLRSAVRIYDTLTCIKSCNMQIRYAPMGRLNTCTVEALPVIADWNIPVLQSNAEQNMKRKQAYMVDVCVLNMCCDTLRQQEFQYVLQWRYYEWHSTLWETLTYACMQTVDYGCLLFIPPWKP
jgi:hypothetical protein